jgi:hypothetical protein
VLSARSSEAWRSQQPIADCGEVIVSRAAELGRLDELVDRLRAGDGDALVVHGAPGIGETTLLDALVERCGAEVTLLRTRGVETEAEPALSAGHYGNLSITGRWFTPGATTPCLRGALGGRRVSLIVPAT